MGGDPRLRIRRPPATAIVTASGLRAWVGARLRARAAEIDGAVPPRWRDETRRGALGHRSRSGGDLRTPRAPRGDALGVLEEGAVSSATAVLDVLPRPRLAERYPDAALVAHAPDAVITPGLVDAHTHAPWFGSRDGEYAVRMAGGDYEAIAAAGGGIVSSMRAVRAATLQVLADTLAARVARMAALG